jgi:hypothetical protein
MLGKLGTLALGVDMSEGGSSIAPNPGPCGEEPAAGRTPPRAAGWSRGSTEGAPVSVLVSTPVAVIVLPPKLRSEPAGPERGPAPRALAPDAG